MTSSSDRPSYEPQLHTAPSMRRRKALGLMAAGASALANPLSGWTRSLRSPPRPVLGTPEQLAAERLLLELKRNPDVLRLRSQLKAELLQSRIGKTPDGAATIDRAMSQWTNSLILGEIVTHRTSPVFLWTTDDTPRSWLGHKLDGVGVSGDNPDAIYRQATIDGGKSWEIVGQYDATNPASQLIVQVDRASTIHPAAMMDMNSPKPSVVSATLAVFTDRDLRPGQDGKFRMTLGPSGEGPNHVVTKPGEVSLGTRDMLSDWRQRPCELIIREIGASSPIAAKEMLSRAEIVRNALEDLPGYVRFWAKFPEIWFGGLKPNSISEARPRNGGWGYVAGLKFDLAPGQAAIVTTDRGGAAYTGFQLNDPWMIQPDVTLHQNCLNLSQAKASPDGTYTYVISPTDPGVANWLDTTGLHSGIGIIRWQGTPPEAGKAALIRNFKVVSLSEVDRMTELPRVTAEQRRLQLAARGPAYATRTT